MDPPSIDATMGCPKVPFMEMSPEPTADLPPLPMTERPTEGPDCASNSADLPTIRSDVRSSTNEMARVPVFIVDMPQDYCFEYTCIGGV